MTWITYYDQTLLLLLYSRAVFQIKNLLTYKKFLSKFLSCEHIGSFILPVQEVRIWLPIIVLWATALTSNETQLLDQSTVLKLFWTHAYLPICGDGGTQWEGDQCYHRTYTLNQRLWSHCNVRRSIPDGRDSWSSCYGRRLVFESWLRILDGHFLILICCKFYCFFKKMGQPRPFFNLFSALT